MTTVVRRFAWHMLGAAIGLALAMLVVALTRSVVPAPSPWAEAALTVVGAAALGLVPGARELEVTAARTMLGTTAELVVPAHQRPAHRARTAVWVVVHLATGLLVAVALFALVPLAGLVAAESVVGRHLGSSLPVPDGAAARILTVVAAVAVALVCVGLTWPAGVAARALAGKVLGPTPSDRADVALARARREAEHTRLARELHDGIGHALTIISIQAAAGRRVAATDPDAATAALTAVEDTARGALAELDALLGALRDDSAGARTTGLDDVVDAHRRAGMDLHAEVSLTDDLPGLLRRSVERIATEALTNAHRHGGPGPVHLRVAATPSAVDIELSNPLPSEGAVRRRDGRGLPGMRERVALFGGRLTTGPDGDRWLLLATLPLDRRP
ncbi:sensor histidine kinase [Xylanimonas sp. McL0601]|uniref:sensor histidine kinase n=1 Tax=Xylanimonas sp. McL0601 TaxID=3414739 RepID=UPI003CF56BDB